MTKFKAYDTVRVSYEAKYVTATNVGLSHYVLLENGGIVLSPPGATVELVSPALPEEPAVGSVVKTADTVWVRVALGTSTEHRWLPTGSRVRGAWAEVCSLAVDGKPTVLLRGEGPDPVDGHDDAEA